jgi:dipeptide transport system permease protein
MKSPQGAFGNASSGRALAPPGGRNQRPGEAGSAPASELAALHAGGGKHAVPTEQTSPPGPLREFWLSFSANRGAVIGMAVVVTLLLLALLAPWLAPHLPNQTDSSAFLRPPAWQEGGSMQFLLGTDAIGRDILSRLIHGSRLSLSIGLVVVLMSLAMGIGLGLVAGFARGIVEIAIMRLMDIILTLPSLLLAIVIVAILGPGLVNAMLAVAVVVLPHYVRITRASVIAEVAKDYVTAARISGAGTLRLMFSEVLPNCAAPLIVQASLGASTAILDAAALGFLGLGAQPPSPEWGTMLADARESVLRAWWVVTFPGLAILMAVLAFNLLGDGLRDALDPKLKR